MSARDPKLVALLFNECINNQDLNGLSALMTGDHVFIDREGNVNQPKESMVRGWKEFFRQFPDYRNTFNRIESRNNLVVILGFAYWSETQAYDPVIWTALVECDLVKEWRVHADTEMNRQRFNLQ